MGISTTVVATMGITITLTTIWVAPGTMDATPLTAHSPSGASFRIETA
jgi:hypothetical protein